MRDIVFFSFMVVCLVACDRDTSRANAPAQGPPPDVVRFPVTASHAEYAYFDADGDRRHAGSLEEVPAPARDYVAVHVGAKTRPPDGKVYLLDHAASDGRIAAARLADAKNVARDAVSAWAGAEAGLNVWETALRGSSGEEPSTGKPQQKKERRPRRARNRKSGVEITSVSDEPVRSIEIVRVGGSVPQPKKRGDDRITAAWGWRPVTMYSSRSCGWCTRARRFMRENDVPFDEHFVDEDADAHRRMARVARKAGFSGGGVPTIVIGRRGKVMQGWDEERFVELARR